MCENPDAGQPIWPSTGQNAARSASARCRRSAFADFLAPRPRRSRVILIGDEIFTMVGGHVLTSVTADTGGVIPRRLDASRLDAS
jgi:hypothetical protein